MMCHHNGKLAQATIPFQIYREFFPVNESLYRGTMFRELYRPYVKMMRR
ncbi:MAG: spore coat associated protein CotJA [Bacilli bacterium]|nr:spore coat associated protein CotJA [Bacilli bacterium]